MGDIGEPTIFVLLVAIVGLVIVLTIATLCGSVG